MEYRVLTRNEQALLTGHARYIKGGSWWHMSDVFISHPDLNWNSFRYAHMKKPPADGSRLPVFLYEIAPERPYYPMASFFSGCGGADLGFEYAGFYSVAAVESDFNSCQSYGLNHPNTVLIGQPDSFGEISDFPDIQKGLRIAGIKEFHKGVFIGSPPDEYHALLFIKYLELYTPLTFFLKVQKITDKMEKALKPLKYKVTFLEASDSYFGTPRSGSFEILIGTRFGSVSVPNKDIYGVRFINTDYVLSKKERRPVSCWNPILSLTENNSDMEIPDAPVLFVRDAAQLKYGMYSGVSEFHRQHPSHEVDFTEIPSVLHPFIPRKLTIREYANVSGFPPNYQFYGDYNSKYQQIRKSISPLTAYYCAKKIREALDRTVRAIKK